MPTITPYEATLLSYLARHTNLPLAQRRRLMAKLKGKALQVAKELESGEYRETHSRRTARGLRTWAETNNKLAKRL